MSTLYALSVLFQIDKKMLAHSLRRWSKIFPRQHRHRVAGMSTEAEPSTTVNRILLRIQEDRQTKLLTRWISTES